MHKALLFAALVSAGALAAAEPAALPYQDSSLAVDQRVDDLLGRMTLEEKIAQFLGTESSLSYVSCWNANEAVFPTLVSPEDVILSDELNHASIIDGMRLMSKSVTKKVYKHKKRRIIFSPTDCVSRIVIMITHNGLTGKNGD